jgi:hypothetical protein
MLNICVTYWLGGFRLFMDLGFILYYSHVYKGVSSHLYKTALINHVNHTTLHYCKERISERDKLQGRGG